MKAGKITAITAAVCTLPIGYAVYSRGRCAPLTDTVRSRLVSYIGHKYGIGPDAGLRLSGQSLVGPTCYRRLEFEWQSRQRPVRLSLFATPDLRYLTRELLDANSDPTREATENQKDFADVARGDLPALGPPDAPVTITVFSDFECPYCARFAGIIRKDVLPAEGKQVRLVFRQFPLSMHPWARTAAEASACAYQQKNEYFWSFHDFFFDHQHELGPQNIQQQILDHARGIAGLDQAKFKSCIAREGGKALVEREVAYGNAHGIGATPTVFVNGKQTEVVAPEQLLTIIRELGSTPSRP